MLSLFGSAANAVTLSEVKTSYRNYARKYHPDKGGGHSDVMKAINKAYGVLVAAEGKRQELRERIRRLLQEREEQRRKEEQERRRKEEEEERRRKEEEEERRRKEEEESQQAYERFKDLALDMLETSEHCREFNKRQKVLEMATASTPGFDKYVPRYMSVTFPRCHYMDHKAVDQAEKDFWIKKDEFNTWKRIYESQRKRWFHFCAANLYGYPYQLECRT